MLERRLDEAIFAHGTVFDFLIREEDDIANLSADRVEPGYNLGTKASIERVLSPANAGRPMSVRMGLYEIQNPLQTYVEDKKQLSVAGVACHSRISIFCLLKGRVLGFGGYLMPICSAYVSVVISLL